MKKILAIVLILLMALQTVPFSAAAAEEEHHHGEEPVEAAATEEEKTEEEVPPAEEEPVSAESGEEEAPAGLSPRLPEAPGEGLTVDDGSAAGTEALPAAAETDAVTAPTGMWVAGTAANGIPMDIDVFVSGTQTSGTTNARTYTYTSLLCLPGSADVSACFLSWDGEAQATVDGTTVDSGMCAVPPVGATKSYSIKVGRNTYVYNITTYQGSAAVTAVFIDIDESNGNPTIAQMDADPDHNVTCTGRINIAGTWYAMPKMKGRGNASWSSSDDKKPYNITLDGKIQFPGIDEAKTKKWSFLAESLDRSLLCNRIGFRLAKEMGVGQDAAPADVWMNGEYQGCYTVTPKTDSYVTKNGWMIEQDNYKEDPVAQGGDPQFQLEGLKEASGWSSCYNRITVKKMGDDFLGYDAAGEADESAENLTDKATNVIKPWLQDAWDAIRSSDGYNAKGKYYTEYIDIESFAKMYLMQEYDKNYDVCAGSLLYHRDGQADTDKLFAGPIWDLDNSMGSTCSNSSLGSQSDRRSAQGDFIENITEYKTSIYKALGRHEDFMEEVKFQYNRYRDFFDALDDDLDQMAEELADSAVMNEKKVKNLGNGQYTNLHYYRSATTLGSGEYRQSYVATSQWSDYTANLRTYITVRSLWFHNSSKYYDPDFVDPLTCEHQYQTVTVPATCTADGSVTYTCPICRNTYTEVLPKIPHDYQDGACTMCGETLVTATIVCSSGASVTVYETQSPDSAHVENAATAHPRDSATGRIDCAGDGQINFVVVLAEGYILDGVAAEPADSYKNLKLPIDTGIDNGYRLTKVKGDLTITVTAHCGHDYTDAVTPPTCTEAGYTTHTCAYCGDEYVDTEVPALGHDLTDYPAQDPTCTEIGWEAYQACSRCDYSTYAEIPATGHAWGAPTYEWAADNSSVTATRVCANDGSHRETETAAATGTKTKEPTCTEKGETTYTSAAFANSAFAGQTKTVEDIPATGHTPGEAQKENVKASTCTGEGSYDMAVYCTVCGKELSRTTETVVALGHAWGTPTYVWSADNGSVTATRVCSHDSSHKETETVDTTSAVTTPAACETKGKTTYTATFTNTAFTKQTKTVEDVPATGHTPGEAQKENVKASTCTGEGSYDMAVYCTVCGKELSRTTETVAALGHSWGTPSYSWSDDNSSVTATRICGHDSTHKETETVDTTSAVTTPATCTAKGKTTYTAAFTNTAFTKQTKTVEDVDMLGHAWGTPTYAWSADNGSVTATRICGHDSSHKETETVNTTSKITKQPTCTEKGERTYTATFTNSAFAAQTKKEDIAVTGHAWGTPTYAWSADNSSVTATRVCSHDPAHKETETVNTASRVTKQPTCTEKGERTYTATFTNGAFAAQTKTEDIAATGHSWDTPAYTWAADNSTATAERVCRNDASHRETETVKTSSAVTKEPTCEEPGETTWTAAFTNKAFTGQTKTEKNIDPLGHVPGDPVTENVVAPTEEADGSHDEAVYCTRCGKELSRTTVTDTYAKPVFKSQSLVLSGQIGLNFFLMLPEIEGVDYAKSYMEFAVSGKDGVTSVDPYDPSHTNTSGEYYGFTCYVNSIQMADTITATFHYGDGKTVSKEYSVARYVEFFEQNAGSFNDKTIALIRAIADFGHYEQIYLSSINDWTIGKDHAEMARYYTEAFDYASVRTAVNGMAFAKSLDGSKVEKATYKLHLDSATTVDVFLKPAAGVTLTASAVFNGKTYRVEKQADGRYLVRIPDISAHQLGDMITVNGSCGGAFTVRVSALSYVRSVLANDMPAADRNGMSALYGYYAAVIAYRT